MAATSLQAAAQNRNFIINIALGLGNSGFDIPDPSITGEISRICYPVAGLQVQKRISDRWALNIFPHLGMSGNKRVLSNPIGSITELKSISAFFNLSVHPKYFFHRSFYTSVGPEVSYLLWNYGSTFNEEERLSNQKETDFFNRTNFLISSSIGYSKKIASSKKGTPIEIDALWFIELRLKKGITNILDSSIFSESSTISSIELVTGLSFSSKE